MSLRLTLILCSFSGLPAFAETPIANVICAAQAQIEARLTKTYGSVLSGQGVRGPDSVMEIWAAKNGDWTLVQTYANGQSCILAMGSDWADLTQGGAG